MTTRSPPGDPEEFRGQTLTPVSPKPIHYPVPANIPVLEKQMDPVFNDTATHYPPEDAHQDQKSNDSSSDSLYAEQSNAADQQGQNGAAAQVSGADDDYAQTLSFEDGEGADNQDTSTIQNFAQPRQVPADAPSDAALAPTQAGQAPYIPYDFAANPSAQGGKAQEPTNGIATQAATKPDEGGVDFQALLDNLAGNAPTPSAQNTAPPANPSAVPAPSAAHSKSPTTALPGNPNLPPRPPPQEKPATHPNYTPGDDIRSYHPHSQKTAAASYRTQPGLPPLMTGTPGTATAGLTPAFQQTPVSAITQRTQSPATPSYRQRDSVDLRRNERDGPDDSDIPWGPETQKLYDEFLHDERIYVTEGQWDKFPPGSRLFIGNLPTEKVTKRDIFHIFHRHGKLAQISIKQAYGFVQYLEADACHRALQHEQGSMVRGRKIHLEVSKPQRNTRGSTDQGTRGARRRSRSPDYTRGGSTQPPRNVDRYTSGGGGSPRRDEFRRVRDDYRPGRSPSPRRRGGRDRSRDRYDGRRRSRSRSPYGRGGRYRSPSPRHDPDDDLPLPRRAPRDVPDVQILVIQPQDMDRAFIAWVERGFQDAGVRCDVLLLSPRLDEAAVIRRQILEGVIAVSRITRVSQQTAKVPLQVFNRSAGPANVTFEEYTDLDPMVCAQLVIRARDQARAQPTPQYPAQYGMPPPQYGMPPAQPSVSYAVAPQPQPGPGATPDLSNLISTLDSTGLQKLLATIQNPAGAPASASLPPQQAPPPAASTLTPDIARLLGNTGGAANAAPTSAYGQPPPQMQGYAHQAPVSAYASLAGNPALAGMMGQPSGATPMQPMTGAGMPPSVAPAASGAPPQPQDMQEIMAQLAKYRR
ncbi:uncharacterized protein K452DRAFT_295986 [Aplosporella prunicola CBS 121167]|uniref:RRM domain-containing protein n=1 Tax=Aplosporella prunicola CBS 121167 TaxID=1176127 RepID=A0A6A6BKB1_9PEZI|nr:uncharacterized protein K452DRAFT_295986 [Aplosporella prunicola CBS 121167]KAF2144552.1 hypothetical protein K452DRAFT_295986 [Aplosporella prunicola CBS 121167]